MNRRYLLLTAAAVSFAVLPTPALADEIYAVTPSGSTENLFDTSVTDASDRIVNTCIDVGWTVISSTSTVVVCEAQFATMESALKGLFMGNAYSTPPRHYVRFNLAGLGRSTRATVNAWAETQMAFGQTRKEDLVSAHYHNEVMTFFSVAGGREPPGTEFPNHALIGFASKAVKDPEKGLKVTSISESSAADRAGIMIDDVVTRIARERIKTGNDILDGLHKAIKEETYEVELYRNGKKMIFELAREFRPTEVEPDLPLLLEPEPAPTTTTVLAPLSMADELAKFAKLRDEGILSEEEFEQQKARLLNQ